MKVPTDFLTKIDTEKRSDLSQEEKEKLVVSEIHRLYASTSNSNLKIKKTINNGLHPLSRNEILTVLQWLDKGHNIIRVPASNFPFELIKPSHDDSYKKERKIDPKAHISVQVLPYFAHWHRLYQSRNTIDVDKLEPKLVKELKNILQKIDKEFNINPKARLTIPNNKHSTKARNLALEYLASKNIIDYNMINTSEIEIYLNFNKLDNLRQKFREYTKRKESEDANKIIYEVNFNEIKGELTLNKKLLTKLHLNSENEAVISFLIKNPNKIHTKKEIETEIGRTIGKDFHKIVDNLKFSKDQKKLFFRTSKDGIIFNNPIRKKDL